MGTKVYYTLVDTWEEKYLAWKIVVAVVTESTGYSIYE